MRKQSEQLFMCFYLIAGSLAEQSSKWRSESLWKLVVVATFLCSVGVSKRLVCRVHSVSGLGSLPFNPSLAGKSEREKVGGTGKERRHTVESRALSFSRYPFSLSPSSLYYCFLDPSLQVSFYFVIFKVRFQPQWKIQCTNKSESSVNWGEKIPFGPLHRLLLSSPPQTGSY